MAKYKHKDFFFNKAKQMGYAARSIFKIEEIDKDFSLIKPGIKILDLGCSPGSWIQYIEKKIPSHNRYIVGIDLVPLKIKIGANIHFIQGDIFETKLPIELFDLIISDMAPKTCGIKSVDQERSLNLCVQALEIAKKNLRKNGNFCLKILEGKDFSEFVKVCRIFFSDVKIRKPKSTRVGSMETFIIALGFKALK